MIGIWFLFSRKTIDLKIDNRIFALITSIVAIYISSSFVRLEIFASVGLIILGSIGLTILFKKVFQSNVFPPTKIVFCSDNCNFISNTCYSFLKIKTGFPGQTFLLQ